MTAGALYQIQNSKNSENNFLEYNPQISFFKVVYRRHTLFSIDNIIINDLSRTSVDYSNAVIIKCDIPRNGDLLKNLYLTFELPNVYSGKSSNNPENFYEFRWIENIGINIFKSVKFKFNDKSIETLYSDYINIWKELTMDDTEKKFFNKCIGNIKELTDPKNGLGQNGVYPHSIKSNDNTLLSTANNKETIYNNNNTSGVISSIADVDIESTFPSIIGRKIKVPLPFFFTKNHGMALPLIALQYTTCSLELEMRSFKDLYTILETDINKTYIGKRVKPTEAYHHIQHFTKAPFSNGDNVFIKPNIEGEYIFLETDERNKFAINSHEYLIEQSKNLDIDGIPIISNVETTTYRMDIFNPVKYITWVVKRNDMSKINIWNNYSNWISEIPPYSKQYINSRYYIGGEKTYNNTPNNYTIDYFNEQYYNISNNRTVFYTYNDENHKTKYNTTYFKKNILTNFKLELDGQIRIDKDIDYFGKQQIYQHFKKNTKDGIYVYSFSLNPNDFQPSGSCNFSNIQNAKIFLKKNILESFGDHEPVGHDFKCYIYTVNYNILVIKSGMADLKFVN